MPLDLSCPKCNHMFPVTEARHPVGVQCPGCEADLTAEFRKVPPPVAPGNPPYELLVSVGKPPGAPPALPGGGKKLRLDDEDGAQRGGGSMLVVVLAGVGALVVTLGGLAVTGYVLFTNLDTAAAPTKRSTSTGGGGGVTIPGEDPNPGGGGTKGGGTKGGTKGGGTIPDRPVDPPRPKDTFTLRPVPGSLTPISPPAAIDPASPQTILLPGQAGAVAVGGGGRYIVMHFPQGRLAVFDANTGAIEHEAGAPSGDVLLAAGANKVVVSVAGGPTKYRVYSLPDLKPEHEFEGTLFHGARAMAMGSRTNGPLLMVDPFGHVVLMDIKSGKPVEGSDDQHLAIPCGQLRASGNGQLFLAGNGYGGNDKFYLVDESSKKWRKLDLETFAAYPGADGREIFGKNRIVDPKGTQLAGKGATAAENVWYVPALTATGDYFLKVNQIQIGKWPQEKKSVSIAVHKGPKNVDKPVLTAWEWLPEAENFFGAFNEPVAFDRHLFLIPEAKLLVIMNRDKTKLVVRRILI